MDTITANLESCFYEWKKKFKDATVSKEVGFLTAELETTLQKLLAQLEIDKVSITDSCDGKWNGYYIEATQEAYNLLVADGYIKYNGIKIRDDIAKYFRVMSDNVFEYSGIIGVTEFKPLYIVDGKLSATKEG